MKLLRLFPKELKDRMYKINKIIISLILLFILVIFSFNLKNFRIDASSDTLVSQNDKDFLYFNYYNEIFDSNNYLVLAIKSSKEIDKKYIKHIENISLKISELDNVYNIFNINNAPILLLNNSKITDLSNQNIQTIIDNEYNIKDVLNEFIENPIYKDQIINNKKNISSIIIYLEKNNELKNLKNNYKDKELNSEYKRDYLKIKNKIDEDRKKLIRNLRSIIENTDTDYEYFLGGIEMITDDVITYVKNDILIFSISAIIIIILVLFFIFRELKWVVISLLTSFYSVLLMFGILGLTKIEVTAISSNFASLMFILSISMNIHIINHYRQSSTEDSKKLNNTIKIMIWPCLYTVLTTVVAFISLTISDIKPIIDFGSIMIISLMVILFSSFTLLPLLISIFPSTNKLIINNFTIIQFFNNKSLGSSNFIISFSILLFLISIYGISKLNVENSFINYFDENTEIYKGMKLIDTELGGTTPMDIILKFNNNEIEEFNSSSNESSDDSLFEDEIFLDEMFDTNDENKIWFTNEKLKTIKDIHTYLESRSEIGKVQSISSLLDVANLINKNELSIFEISILYDEIPDNLKKDLIYPYLSVDENMVKITARVKDSYNINRANLLDEVNLYLNNNHKENLIEFKVNGLLVLYNNMLQSLFSSQIKSIGFVILAIFIMFLILFRSWRLSVIGIIPNIFASSYILGIIGLLKIPLDIMTITIAAISIGIAVDNTIHYLYRYKNNYKTYKDIKKSIKLTHESVGFAVLTTSITIAFGFSVLSFSNFIPTVLFGIFTSLAMILAMFGVLILLPSILYKFK